MGLWTLCKSFFENVTCSSIFYFSLCFFVTTLYERNSSSSCCFLPRGCTAHDNENNLASTAFLLSGQLSVAFFLHLGYLDFENICCFHSSFHGYFYYPHGDYSFMDSSRSFIDRLFILAFSFILHFPIIFDIMTMISVTL